MPRYLAQNWWLVALRGAIALAFGFALLLWSDLSLGGLVLLFGTYALADAIVSLVWAFWSWGRPVDRWPVVLEGLVSIGFGILAYAWPFIPRSLLYVLAAWGVITDVLEVIAAARASAELAVHWFLGLAGVASLFLAILLLSIPHAGQEAVARLIVMYAVVFGILMLLAAARLKRFAAVSSAAAR
jgi:uncharacterized membrane protein HdeD (DUF308 family)